MITPEFYRQIMAETRASNRRFGEECLRLARQAVDSGSIERSASGALTLAHGGPKPSIIAEASPPLRGPGPDCLPSNRPTGITDTHFD